jgi:hypothetical protein
MTAHTIRYIKTETVPERTMDPTWRDLPWIDMTTDQKFEFLNKWCENLSVAVQQLQAENRYLRERLQAVEAKLPGDIS